MAKSPGPFRTPRLPRRGTIDLTPVVVIGLGRFGAALSRELSDNGVEVLGIDSDPRNVHDCEPHLTDALIGDTTDPETLIQAGVGEMDRAVVGIGSNLEGSILTASNIVELGIREIWAKADSDAHARILAQIGVHHVVRPERDTGRRVAHLLGGRFEEFVEMDQGYGMSTLVPTRRLLAGPVHLAELYRKFRVHGVAVKPADGAWEPLTDGRQLKADDVVIIAGDPRDLEAFTAG